LSDYGFKAILQDTEPAIAGAKDRLFLTAPSERTALERPPQGTAACAVSWIRIRAYLPAAGLRVLQLPGAVGFVSFGNHPAPLHEHEIESLATASATGFVSSRIPI
jgi:hypothetical protein